MPSVKYSHGSRKCFSCLVPRISVARRSCPEPGIDLVGLRSVASRAKLLDLSWAMGAQATVGTGTAAVRRSGSWRLGSNK